MFIDMATIIESQGQTIDNIEFSVAKAENYVEKVSVPTLPIRSQTGPPRPQGCEAIPVRGAKGIVFLSLPVHGYACTRCLALTFSRSRSPLARSRLSPSQPSLQALSRQSASLRYFSGCDVILGLVWICAVSGHSPGFS